MESAAGFKHQVLSPILLSSFHLILHAAGFKHQLLSPILLSSFHLILQSYNWQQVSSKLSFCQNNWQWNISPKITIINSYQMIS